MAIIVGYFPLLTYIILILTVIYLVYRKNWIEDEGSFRMKALTVLGIIIACSLLNTILLTAPILDGTGFASSLPELVMWIWPDLLVLVVLGADIIRTGGFRILRE